MRIQEITTYLQGLNPYLPHSLIQLAILIKLAEVGGLNNIQVKSKSIHTPEHTTPANIYGLTFLTSSGGKDKTLRDLDKNLSGFIQDDFTSRAQDAKKRRLQELIDEARDIFPDQEGEQKRYITANRPRFLIREMSDATLEGFVAMRQAYYQAGWGGTFVKISEFGDYITSDNTARSEFLSMLTEVYDHGDNNAKVTKGERENVPVYGVPSSAIMHTSPAGLLEGRNHEKLMTFLNRGIARRSFICYPEQSLEFETDDIKENITRKREGIRKSEMIHEVCVSYFRDFYYKTRCEDDIVHNSYNTFILTEEAEVAIEQYEVGNLIKASKMGKDTRQVGLISEISGRSWKALKLSGILASFEHPEQKEVTEVDIKNAISICEEYGIHLTRFYQAGETPEYERLYHYFIENVGVWQTTMDLRAQKFVYKDHFSKWFDEALSIIKEMLEQKGYLFEEEKNGSWGKKYKASKMTVEGDRGKKVIISQGDTNNPTETTFTPREVEFKRIHEVTKENKAWSASCFKDNYRRDDNALGSLDFAVFDMDGDQTVKECLEILNSRKLLSCIITTRNHQKKKQVGQGEREKLDRFRILLPFDKRVTFTKKEYKEKIKVIAETLGFKPDVAAINISRLWFGNPRQKYLYTKGGMIDPLVFHKSIIPQKQHKEYSNMGDNSGIKKWFAENYMKYGGRNNALYIVLKFFLNDKGVSPDKAWQAVLDVNNMLPIPLEEKELHETVYKSLPKTI